MSWKYMTNIGIWFAALTLLSPVVLAASLPGKTGDTSPNTARLFRDINADATQIESGAMRLDELTKTSGATWLDYDRQWNLIKPSQEDMQIKLGRLEGMHASMSPSELKQFDQIKPMVESVRRVTRDLRTTLDKPGISTTDARFKTFATTLKNDASKLDRASAS